ncbi:AAA family ATPase [Patescibacteria group bacterium]
MFTFNPKEAAIFQAVKWEKCLWLAKPLNKLFLVFFIFTTLVFSFGFLGQLYEKDFLSFSLGLLVIFLTLFLVFWLKDNFLNLKLKKPEIKTEIKQVVLKPKNYNLAEFLSFEVAKAVSKSIKFAKSKKLPEIPSSLLLYFLLADNPKLNFIFSRVLLDLKEIKKILESHFKDLKPENFNEAYSKDFQDSIVESLKIANEKGNLRIEIGDMIAGLAEHNLLFKKILIDLNLTTKDIENLTWWLESLEEKMEKNKKWWEYENLMKQGTLAKEWTSGYTIALDKYSTDWSDIAKRKGFPEIIGHKEELEAVERVLARREINNVLVVGEAGVGKKSMILALTQKSFLGQSLPEVNYKRIVELDIPALLSRLTDKEEVEATLDEIFRETASAGNIILIIDDFHNYVGGVERPGVIDISGVLSSYLHLPQFQIVAVTTYAGLHKNIEERPSILALFEKVEVPEISEREVLMILENLTFLLERKYKRFISYPALRQIVFYCQKYIPAIPFPKKAMDLLDEVAVFVSSTKDKVILPEHVARIVSEKTQIPVGQIEVKEKETLLNLENLIHQRIINQEEAVKETSSALRRARAEVTVKKGPMGTFLFLGPTGVGKTETAKAIAEIYFGSEQRMIRLDMSEFQSVSDIPRLIGSSGEEGLLTTQVKENPFALILLDEIEKAHPNILNLFLQVLDEGYVTDGLGRKVDFKNSIIIATSNAGYKIILKALKEKTEWSEVKQELLDHLFQEAIFRPEFINRFDGVTVFGPLSKENLLSIAELMLQKLKKNLKEKGIDFEITQPLKEKIVELGYNPTFGAREMKRVIQDKVENVLAPALLSGELKRGDRAKIDEEFKLIINY